MENRNNNEMLKEVLQRGMELAGLAAFCTFAVLVCILFALVGIVYSLANFTVKRLQKGRQL